MLNKCVVSAINNDGRARAPVLVSVCVYFFTCLRACYKLKCTIEPNVSLSLSASPPYVSLIRDPLLAYVCVCVCVVIFLSIDKYVCFKLVSNTTAATFHTRYVYTTEY